MTRTKLCRLILLTDCWDVIRNNSGSYTHRRVMSLRRREMKIDRSGRSFAPISAKVPASFSIRPKPASVSRIGEGDGSWNLIDLKG